MRAHPRHDTVARVQPAAEGRPRDTRVNNQRSSGPYYALIRCQGEHGRFATLLSAEASTSVLYRKQTPFAGDTPEALQSPVFKHQT